MTGVRLCFEEKGKCPICNKVFEKGETAIEVATDKAVVGFLHYECSLLMKDVISYITKLENGG
jgi:hypothetical protein